jgi:hypothetical protein
MHWQQRKRKLTGAVMRVGQQLGWLSLLLLLLLLLPLLLLVLL